MLPCSVVNAYKSISPINSNILLTFSKENVNKYRALLIKEGHLHHFLKTNIPDKEHMCYKQNYIVL